MSSNYPAGAEFDPNAPWNQSEPKDMEFDVTCSQSLSKTVTVITNNYIPGAEGVDWDVDDEGQPYATPWYDGPDTSDTNWADEYHANDYHNPLQLLQLFEEVLKKNLEKGIVFKSPGFTQRLIKECQGWTEDEIEYIKD